MDSAECLIDRSTESAYSAWLRYMNTTSSCVVQMYHTWPRGQHIPPDMCHSTYRAASATEAWLLLHWDQHPLTTNHWHKFSCRSAWIVHWQCSGVDWWTAVSSWWRRCWSGRHCRLSWCWSGRHCRLSWWPLPLMLSHLRDESLEQA